MEASAWLAAALGRLAGSGFNLTGVVDVARFDAEAPAGACLRAAAPWARTAVVIASGGRALWEALPARHAGRCDGDGPARPEDRDPIDHFTDAAVSAEVERLSRDIPTARARILSPFRPEGWRVSFTRLAEHAGLGTSDTVLRLLLHPEYGPWVSLRACLLTDLDLPASGRLESFRPCEGCPRPCLAACPAGVLTQAGWDHAACFEYRRRGPNCLDGCAPRMACPVGAAHRYGPEEMRHRQLAAMR